MRKVKTYRKERSTKKPKKSARMRKTLQGFLSSKQMNVTKFQSSATWQNTVSEVKFPKAKRFYRPTVMNDMLYDLPTTNQGRTTTMGFGNKQIATLATRLNAKYNPPPDRYNIADFTKTNKIHKKGKSFGIQHSARKYDKRGIMPQL